jgi:hypothetical protein
MKALIPGFALLTLVAAAVLPIDSHAQTATSGGAPAMAPDTGAAPTSTTKKSKKSKKSTSSHAKKKSKKHSTSQTSSAKQLHHSVSAGRHSPHNAS